MNAKSSKGYSLPLNSLSLTSEANQVTALRTRVLPMFEPIVKSMSYGWIKSPKSGYATRTPHEDSAWLCWRTFSLTQSLLEAVVGKGTPALRASRLKKALDDNSNAKVTIDKLLVALTIRVKKVLAFKDLTPDTRKTLEAFITDPTLKLLKGSWSFIINEVRTEMGAILKKHKLMVSPQFNYKTKRSIGPKADKVIERFSQYCKSLGFTVKVHSEGEYNYGDKGCLEARKPVNDGAASIVLVGIPKDGVYPSYEVGTKTFSWARMGVDSGVTDWGSEESVEATIDACIEQCEEAIEKRLHAEANGTKVDFGGRTLLLLPEKLAKIVADLKAGKSFSIHPGGFGDQYTYSTTPVKNNWQRAGRASDQITQLVGKQVYYSIQELD